MVKLLRPIPTLSLVICGFFVLSGCRNLQLEKRTLIPVPQPTIEVRSIGGMQASEGPADSITIIVAAPDAERVRIHSQAEAGDSPILLSDIQAAAMKSDGAYKIDFDIAADYRGEIWAEATYRDGAIRRSDAALVRGGARTANQPLTVQAIGGSVGTDDSARADKLTGGKISRAEFIAGEPDLRVTINLPAFLMTLWQKGKEIRTYPIGIGGMQFPLPIGEREATMIVFHPRWIPFRRSSMIGPESSGKIKISLGGGYFIHQARGEEEIGHVGSEGCIKMLQADLHDLTEKIVYARSLPVSHINFDQLEQQGERLAVPFAAPLLVDINYDLQVIENGVLHLYPDIYKRGVFAVDSLRAELQGAGVFDDKMLERMLNQIRDGKQFVIPVKEIKRGRWKAGSVQPLTARRREGLRKTGHAQLLLPIGNLSNLQRRCSFRSG